MAVKKKKSKSDSNNSLGGFFPGILTGIVLTVTFNYVFNSNPEIGKEKIEEIVSAKEIKKRTYDFYKLLKENEILIPDDEISVKVFNHLVKHKDTKGACDELSKKFNVSSCIIMVLL